MPSVPLSPQDAFNQRAGILTDNFHQVQRRLRRLPEQRHALPVAQGMLHGRIGRKRIVQAERLAPKRLVDLRGALHLAADIGML